jgi:hypothetical protein
MEIAQLTGSGDLRSLWTRRWRVTSLHLEGLRIHIPRADVGSSYIVLQRKPRFRLPPVEFEEITTDDALLEMLPGQKQGKPHSFWIHHLQLRSVARDQPAYFRAELTNPVPAGEIDSEGTFGPWDPDQPGHTSVAANFRFANADLGQFRGLSGTLSSNGHYSGALEHLEVHGRASVPNFELSIAGTPVPLSVDYVAVVDGTNGNTYLKAVTARFLQTTIAFQGEIVDPPGPSPRMIVLTASARDAHVEDLLRLVTKGSDVPLTGMVSVQARFDLPSGPEEVIDRLSLRGRFEISRAFFENSDARSRITDFSRRAQGKLHGDQVSPVIADISGNLLLKRAQADFSNLELSIPGASLFLNGSYGLKNDALNFHGKLRMAAKLSQTTTGLKSVLLRAFNPLFKDGAGGSILPVKITGTRSNPAFGLDLRRHANAASD